MQSLLEFMNRDRLKKYQVYKYFPKSKKELIEIIKQLIKERGYDGDFNDIDVSEVTNMSHLFDYSEFRNFNGDISKWDVSNVENMSCMFSGTIFNGDISKWNVSEVTNMSSMFSGTIFNRDISNWKISKVTDMSFMFADSGFKGDLNSWEVNSNCNTYRMFFKCKAPIPFWKSKK